MKIFVNIRKQFSRKAKVFLLRILRKNTKTKVFVSTLVYTLELD
jgi:hypothetical protein